jgi:hypothetical protein
MQVLQADWDPSGGGGLGFRAKFEFPGLLP